MNTSDGHIYSPRTISEFESYHSIKQEGVDYLSECEILWADYDLIRHDFPSTKCAKNAEIDQWLANRCGSISIRQKELIDLRNSSFESSIVSNSSDFNFRLEHQGRGDVVMMDTFTTVKSIDSQKETRLEGFIDRKGVGVNPERLKFNLDLIKSGSSIKELQSIPDSNGLMSAAEAMREVFAMNLVQWAYDKNPWLPEVENSNGYQLQTIRPYFVMALPFEFHRTGSKKTFRAALLGRQAHIGRVVCRSMTHLNLFHSSQKDGFFAAIDAGNLYFWPDFYKQHSSFSDPLVVGLNADQSLEAYETEFADQLNSRKSCNQAFERIFSPLQWNRHYPKSSKEACFDMIFSYINFNPLRGAVLLEICRQGQEHNCFDHLSHPQFEGAFDRIASQPKDTWEPKRKHWTMQSLAWSILICGEHPKLELLKSKYSEKISPENKALGATLVGDPLRSSALAHLISENN